jgi:TolB-like protein
MRNPLKLVGGLAAVSILATAAWSKADDAGLPLPPIPAPPATVAITPFAAAPITVAGKIVVFPFDPVGEVKGQEWIGTAVQQSLITDLAQLNGVQSSGLVGQSKIEADQIALAKSASAQYLVIGTFQVVEGQIKVTGRIINAATGNNAGILKSTGTLHDLFTLEDTLGAQARKAVAGELHVGKDTPKADQLNTVDAARFGNAQGQQNTFNNDALNAYNRFNYESPYYYPPYYPYYDGYYGYPYGGYYGYGSFGVPFSVIIINDRDGRHGRHDSNVVVTPTATVVTNNNPGPVFAPPVHARPPRMNPYPTQSVASGFGGYGSFPRSPTYIGPEYVGPSNVFYGPGVPLPPGGGVSTSPKQQNQTISPAPLGAPVLPR